MPAAAVIPAAQVVVAFIGPKTSVACLVNLWVNQSAQRIEFCRDCQTRDRERCVGYSRGRGKILSSFEDHQLRRRHTGTDPTVRDEA